MNWQRGISTALMGVGANYQNNYDRYKEEQAMIARENRVYETTMRKEKEMAKWKQKMAIEEEQRQYDLGVSRHPDELKRAGEIKAAEVQGGFDAYIGAIRGNESLSPEQKEQAINAKLGVQTTDYQRKVSSIEDILKNAKTDENGNLMLSQEETIMLQVNGVDTSKGGLKASDILGARETASKNTAGYFKENPITPEQVDAAKMELVRVAQSSGKDVSNYKPTDQEASNYIWNQHFDGEVSRITGTGSASGAPGAPAPGGPPPPPGGGPAPERPSVENPYLGLVEETPGTGALQEGVRPPTGDKISMSIDNLPEQSIMQMAVAQAPDQLKQAAGQDIVLAKRILYQAVAGGRIKMGELQAQPTALVGEGEEGFTNVEPTDPMFQQNRVDQLIRTGRQNTR